MNHITRATTLAVLAVFAGVLALGCTTKSTSEPEAEAGSAPEHDALTTERLEPYECGSITPLHTLDGVFLAGQPDPADFAQARADGVMTVISLRHDGEVTAFDERAVVTGLGLDYVSLPWNGIDELTDDVFDRTRALLDTAERPILLHCGSANRVGAVWIPWRVLDGGLSYDEALTEAKAIGLKTEAYETKARDYVERHRP